MRKLLLLVFFGLSSLTLLHGAQAATVNFTTEEYPPFNYRDGKTPVGATVEQVEKIMTDIGVDYSIEVLPWARAYNEALTAPMTCVFVAAHNNERDKLFKWVEPLLVDRNVLIKHTGSSVTATTLDEARKYLVGTWRGDYTETTLRQANFARIDIGADFKATLKKLMSDRIDLMPISEFYFDKLKQDGDAVEKVTVLSEQPMSIACHKDFPNDLLKKMQAALDKLIADGTQKQIFLKYGLHLGN
ncbi:MULTISPECIES: substrate-binding periplasmic protein [Rhizobium]|uniref:Polar amino acid transport system substrate-binding protein n=1 Tax=Rhizobium paranaense TaxID=1650438 RepID=A0A7W8XPM9_9HYPH|nr:MULTISPECIES: transporter substrate-binding domain-containing protein [Rhizobium]MBB5573206.1 polar amino acid transport system substrate-binding protein [Rhizobium paranaense]PST62424.1 ABC transporter substrate-binding protein [Rhizobium sp. SEMIA4064]